MHAGCHNFHGWRPTTERQVTRQHIENKEIWCGLRVHGVLQIVARLHGPFSIFTELGLGRARSR